MEYLIVFLPLLAALVSGFFGNVIGDRNSCIFNCLLISISAILLFISLLSYSPEDPNFIFPENAEIKNTLGFRGSFISDLFFLGTEPPTKLVLPPCGIIDIFCNDLS